MCPPSFFIRPFSAIPIQLMPAANFSQRDGRDPEGGPSEADSRIYVGKESIYSPSSSRRRRRCSIAALELPWPRLTADGFRCVPPLLLRPLTFTLITSSLTHTLSQEHLVQFLRSRPCQGRIDTSENIGIGIAEQRRAKAICCSFSSSPAFFVRMASLKAVGQLL